MFLPHSLDVLTGMYQSLFPGGNTVFLRYIPSVFTRRIFDLKNYLPYVIFTLTFLIYVLFIFNLIHITICQSRCSPAQDDVYRK